MRVDVWDLEFDDVNREELHAHGISIAVALEVVDGDPRAIPNRAKGGAPVLLIGPTSKGLVSLPIDPTNLYGVHRPRTGYPSKPAEVKRYRQMGRKG